MTAAEQTAASAGPSRRRSTLWTLGFLALTAVGVYTALRIHRAWVRPAAAPLDDLSGILPPEAPDDPAALLGAGAEELAGLTRLAEPPAELANIEGLEFVSAVRSDLPGQTTLQAQFTTEMPPSVALESIRRDLTGRRWRPVEPATAPDAGSTLLFARDAEYLTVRLQDGAFSVTIWFVWVRPQANAEPATR